MLPGQQRLHTGWSAARSAMHLMGNGDTSRPLDMSTVFWKPVPVCTVRGASQEDVVMYTVRLMVGYSQSIKVCSCRPAQATDVVACPRRGNLESGYIHTCV